MFVQSDKNCQKQVLSWKKPLDKIMSRAIIQTTILSTLAMKRDDGEKAVPFLLTESRRMVRAGGWMFRILAPERLV